MFSIGDFSKKTNISISTLRYYDKLGVLTPSFKADSGYRYYTDEQVINALFINNMKRVNLPLDVIKNLSKATDPFDMYKRVSKEKNSLTETVNQLSFFENTYLNVAITITKYQQGIEQIALDTLSGCGYMKKEFQNEKQDIRDFVSGIMMDVLVECNELILNQNKCMRILCTSLSGEADDKDVLIVPVEKYYNISDRDSAGFMPDQKTISMVVVNTCLDFEHPVEELRKAAKEKNIKVGKTPIVDILCDPGDIPEIDTFIAKVHLPIVD